MSSLQPSVIEADALGIAERLAGARVLALTRGERGGNNRIYRVDCVGGKRFALKSYPSQAADPRDRLGTEFAALRFMRRHGMEEIPAAEAAAPEAGYALYEWIDGEPVADPAETDADRATRFVSSLASLCNASEAAALPLASEACLSLAELCAQVERRFTRLAQVAEGVPALARFLDYGARGAFEQARERAIRGYSLLGLDPLAPLPPGARTLSPSDFGFHNALRQRSGRLVFVDFEYFGWDDPVKLIADFLLHPGMQLRPAVAARFRDGALAVFKADKTIAERLELAYPLYGLRWCGIVLNEFLPERWYRRSFATGQNDLQSARDSQLRKAEERLSAVLARLRTS